MKTLIFPLFVVSILNSITASQAFADFAVSEESRKNYSSPNGVLETCFSLQPMPNTRYTKKDPEKIATYCSVNFYSEDAGICPKYWSTSAGIVLHSIDPQQISQSKFESNYCARSDEQSRMTKNRGKLKFTMNQSGTSGTFSIASLLYFHYARYFETTVEVPAAVVRTIDPKTITERMLPQINKLVKPSAKMNHAAWDYVLKAAKSDNAYNPARDVYTTDASGRTVLYGAIVKSGGERYGTEMNGVRSGWGDKQNLDFQKTPAFTALRSESSLLEAIQKGVVAGRSNKQIAADLGSIDPTNTQMIFWMKELTEITLLDFIFSQQDRVGNLDYKWYWLYQSENGEWKSKEDDSAVSRKKMSSLRAPEEIANKSPVLVQRSVIGDNDAGGRTEYSNYTKRTAMLENIRHLSADTYRKLMQLAQDMNVDGPLSHYLRTGFHLSEKYSESIRKNIILAANIYRQSCEQNILRFDLDTEAWLKTGQVTEQTLNCDNP